MNAYELADRFEKFAYLNWFSEASNMLRQQADEIELLKRNMNTATDELLQQADRIAELEKEIVKWEEINKRQTRSIRNKSPQIKELNMEDLETIKEALMQVGFTDAFINYDLKDKAMAMLDRMIKNEPYSK